MSLRSLIKSKRSGSAMAMAIIAIIILMALGSGLLTLGFSSRMISARTISKIEAKIAADAGLTKALFQMNQKLKEFGGETWNAQSLPMAQNEDMLYSNGTFTYRVGRDSGGNFIINSMGRSGQASKMVSATLGIKGLFEYPILTKQDLILKSGTVIDGYNSSDLSDTDNNVQIATAGVGNDQITLNNGVTVNGDVLVGVGGNPGTVIKDNGATTESKNAMAEQPPFPKITAPSLTDKATSIDASGSTLTIGPAESGKYSGINLKRTSSPATLNIEGGNVVLHITGNVYLGQQCEINIKPGSSLTLYLDGNFISDNGASINNPGTPKKFRLYGTSSETQTIDLKAKGDLNAAIYAPEADIVCYASGDIRGSIIGNSFEQKSTGTFYYDEALSKVAPGDKGVRFTVTRWSDSKSDFYAH